MWLCKSISLWISLEREGRNFGSFWEEIPLEIPCFFLPDKAWELSKRAEYKWYRDTRHERKRQRSFSFHSWKHDHFSLWRQKGMKWKKMKREGKMLMVSLDETSSHFIESLNVIHVKFIKISFPVLDSTNNKRMNQESPTERKNFSWHFPLSFSPCFILCIFCWRRVMR